MAMPEVISTQKALHMEKCEMEISKEEEESLKRAMATVENGMQV